MTQLQTLECFMARVKESKKNKSTIIIKRYCHESCDNPSLCNDLLALCNFKPYTKTER